MAHDVGRGLFAEIEDLRAHLRQAWCEHGFPLTSQCGTSLGKCSSNDARELLGTRPGAKAIAALAELKAA